MRMKPAALALAQKAVNHALDVFAASRLAYAMTLIEGRLVGRPVSASGFRPKGLGQSVTAVSRLPIVILDNFMRSLPMGERFRNVPALTGC